MSDLERARRLLAALRDGGRTVRLVDGRVVVEPATPRLQVAVEELQAEIVQVLRNEEHAADLTAAMRRMTSQGRRTAQERPT